ncbi:hypothetical protein BZG35_17175 [Brevundimonas sp. LM2]|uniref:toprim domain-containing protein n=1 Tax=Brevundimonas sp. LM2 TaxID=1938605 RepID=UPI000983F1C5|nr:toprim domain-containing protein [Brevundimonas sp. LM2]AQR63185.1 hypothetical protein BZG35_17175 [Brevundimonas sp. LM2]
MTLAGIVRTLGGDLYQHGLRANVPAPGHGAHDRSVSLLMTDGRLVVHSFGAADWREVMDDLRRRGLIDGDARVVGGGSGGAPARNDVSRRLAVARDLWSAGLSTGPTGLVARHLVCRGVVWSSGIGGLLEHPAAPLSVYRAGGRVSRAMMARIQSVDGATTAVELTYLNPSARPATGLRVPRKTVGTVPAGSAVRLSGAAAAMVVAEGVVTTLSAMARFGLPGWALLSAGNLARWHAPPAARRVVIAGDRGAAGEDAAHRLYHTLRSAGLEASIALPPAPWGDWNEAGPFGPGRQKGGRDGAPETRGSAPLPHGETP